jgi:hypothetical protein
LGAVPVGLEWIDADLAGKVRQAFFLPGDCPLPEMIVRTSAGVVVGGKEKNSAPSRRRLVAIQVRNAKNKKALFRLQPEEGS